VTPIALGKTSDAKSIDGIGETDFVPQPSMKGRFAPSFGGTATAKPRGEGQIGIKSANGPTAKTLSEDPNFQKLSPKMREAFLERMNKNQWNSSTRENYAKLATSTGFAKMSEAEQKQMLETLDKDPSDPNFANDLRYVASSENYRRLDAEMKTEVLSALAHQAQSGKGSNTCADLVAKPGFTELSKDQQKALLRATSGNAEPYSASVRTELEALFQKPEFANGDAKKQGADLKALLEKQTFLPRATTADEGTFSAPGKRVPYKIVGPANPNAKVKTYVIEIDNRKIPVTEHPAPGGKVHHSVEDVAKAIAAAPKESRDKITSVLFEPNVRKDAYMAANGDGQLHCYPVDKTESEDFAASAVIHETGHMVSIAKWGDDAKNGAKWKPWRDAMAKDTLSPSQYAHGKPSAKETAAGGAPVHDDFAESVLLYQRVKGTKQEPEMRRLFPERFKILDTMLN
jgi:hypothetical protein